MSQSYERVKVNDWLVQSISKSAAGIFWNDWRDNALPKAFVMAAFHVVVILVALPVFVVTATVFSGLGNTQVDSWGSGESPAKPKRGRRRRK